jgi:KaiC/GvpD/RAD55 family RecA-like ATPase
MTDDIPDLFDTVDAEPPGDDLPFPRMRPSQRVADAWTSAVKAHNEKNKRSAFLPSPLEVIPSLMYKRSLPAMPWPAQWVDIARRCEHYPGQCLSITAAIGAGKTSFAAQMMLAVSGNSYPVLWDPLELDGEEMDLRVIANMHGAQMGAVRKQWSEERIKHSLVSIGDMWHYVDQHDDPDQHFQATEDALRLAWEVYKVPPALVVDHLGELVAEERDDRAALRRWSKRYRQLAQRTNSWIILLNQVSKSNQGTLTGKVDHESATDTLAVEMGSQAVASAVYNAIVLNVFKADDTPELDSHVMIPKARNTGMEGRVGMRFRKAGGQWSELDYLPATPNAAKAAAEADKKDRSRAAAPRTTAQARADLNAANAGDAAAMRRHKIIETVNRHGMLGIEIAELRKVFGVGRGALFHQAVQELERAGSVEKVSSRIRIVPRGDQ